MKIMDLYIESYAQQIRKEEQDKAREVAHEAWHKQADEYYLIYIEGKQPLFTSFDEWFNEFTKKQGGSEQQKCVECGRPMQKKEIIIKGDEDTCDECLCPE